MALVHRNRTKLAARAHRAATKVERRGIRATYHLHDRVLSNRASRRSFAADVPTLDAAQQEIVGKLDAEGYAVVPFASLFDEATSAAVEEQGSRFDAATRIGLAEGSDEVKVRPGKEFVVRLHSYGAELGFDDPWLAACASRRMLDIANSYLHLWSKLEYLDIWYSVPQQEDAAPVASQRWHRDFNDKHLLKAFLYLVDVDERMGPFEYVPGSAGAGPYAQEWPWAPLGENYPSPDEFAERIPDAAVTTFTAPRGTLVFCNTSGFHRGGLTTTDPRVLATVTYSSPASLASLTERSFRFTGPLDGLDPPTRYALS